MTHPVQSKTFGLIGKYLGQCRLDDGSEFPPTGQELVTLFAFLKMRKINHALVGSVAILHHIQDPTFRPTHDIDVFVQAETERFSRIPPPAGWVRDSRAVGVVSWISPSGGHVDFLTANYVFPGGEKVLASVKVDFSSPLGFPIATVNDLIKLKLNSYRERDFSDVLSLVKSLNKVPTAEELKPINEVQSTNLNLVRKWFAHAQSQRA